MMRPLRPLLAPTLAVLATLLAAAPARADDAKRVAAEHYALGEAAEKREDWQGAIDEFKQAYQAKPHPAPLYKIAKDYERLEEWRSAADYYERYLAESPEDAPDRDKVTAKIEALRARADEGHPVDTPRTGRLVVQANVDGAQVTVDDQVLGQTPFEAVVASGPHRVGVTHEGYLAAERNVEIPAGGTEQIRAELASSGEAPARPGGWLLGLAYGVDVTRTGLRYVFTAGFRLAPERLELNFLLGIFGPNDIGLGAEARYYLSTGSTRPYARIAATLGKATSGIDEARTYGAEAAGGVLFTPFRTSPTGQRSSIEYFVEVGARFTGGGFDSDTTSDENKVARFLVPIQGGIVVRFR